MKMTFFSKQLLLAITSLLLFFSACKNTQPEQTAKPPTQLELGQQVFANNCQMCHGFQGEGTSYTMRAQKIHFNTPDWQKRYSDTQLAGIIHNGRGSMPSFPFSDDESKALIAYIRSLSK